MYIIKSTDTITNEVYQEEYDTLAGVLGGLFEMLEREDSEQLYKEIVNNRFYSDGYYTIELLIPSEKEFFEGNEVHTTDRKVYNLIDAKKQDITLIIDEKGRLVSYYYGWYDYEYVTNLINLEG